MKINGTGRGGHLEKNPGFGKIKENGKLRSEIQALQTLHS
jgi:hypothetical protein